MSDTQPMGGIATPDLRVQVVDAINKMQKSDLQVSEQRFAAMFLIAYMERIENTCQALQQDLTWYKERHRD